MKEQSYMSESELARRANAPVSRVAKLKKAGQLQPDFIVGKTKCFRAERVPALIATLSNTLVEAQ